MKNQSVFVIVFLIACNHLAYADIEIFDERAEFDVVAPGLRIENFESLTGEPSEQGFDFMLAIVDETTNFPPVSPGDIAPEVRFKTRESGFQVIYNPFFDGAPSNSLGASLFSDSPRVEFDPPISALGFDISAYFNYPGTIDATFFDGSKSLGTIVIAVEFEARFVGVVANFGDRITEVVFSNEVDINGEVLLAESLDNVAFGQLTLLGDVNCDGTVDLLDVIPFIEALTNGDFELKADINQDGALDLLDVSAFVKLLDG